MRAMGLAMAALALAACQPNTSADDATLTDDAADGTSGSVLYRAEAIVTMEDETPATGVVVEGNRIVAVGAFDALKEAHGDASVDETFADKVIVPGLIDPHIHMALSSIQYAVPMAPPWPMATPDGIVRGLPDRDAFLARAGELAAGHEGDGPLIIYGYHNLVHGDLTKTDLDALSTDFPIVVWHYSTHDFYLNTEALAWTKVTADLHNEFEGVDLGEDGEPTGRVYEDAVGYLLQTLGPVLFAPDLIKRGYDGFEGLLNRGGVTTVADLGYGLFGFPIEDGNIASNWTSPQEAGFRVYLVPEHRSFLRDFGDDAANTVTDMVSGRIKTPAPVLPQVKFFTDAAFYSQTMRVSAPGYLTGQSEGSEGLWVLKPDEIAPTIKPYWDLGLDVRIHSNGDAAQTATLNALETLQPSRDGQKFVFEHAGLFSPEQVSRAAELGAAISAASHYVFYMGNLYQGPLGEARGQWILPLASLSDAGVPVTVHSDAPLAPPLPLRAAGVHITRATHDGDPLLGTQTLSQYEALEAITIDAAYALGLEAELGSIAPGKLADFTILDADPLTTDGEDWSEIGVWGVVLDGEKRPLTRE